MPDAPRINWLGWGDEAFSRAAAEQRPILLRIGAAWCAPCAEMERDADADPGVVSLVEEDFVPVRVDADRRPDINARYNLGGWPTNAFLSPQGELISGGTFFPPDVFRALLEGVARNWRERRRDVEDAIAAARREIDSRRRARPAGAVPGAAAVASIVDMTMDAFDFRYGGFGDEPKFAHAASVELLLAEYRRTSEARLRDAAVLTLEAFWSDGNANRLADPAGGFFRYSATRDWSAPRPEKVLDEHAALLSAFVSAYQVAGDERWSSAALAILGYVDSALFDRERRLFRASEVASAGGTSSVDDTAIVGWNAEMASAHIKAGLVLDDDRRLATGLAVADRLAADARAPGRAPLMGHVLETGGAVGPVVLADQASTARALVDAYEAAGGHRRLAAAAELLDAVDASFRDPARDCYADTLVDPAAHGYLSQPVYPLTDNSAAADTLLRLAVLLGVPAYASRAGAILRDIGGAVAEHGFVAAPFALAVQRLLAANPTVVNIVGGQRDPRLALALARAAHAPYAPLKCVKYVNEAGDVAGLGVDTGSLTAPVAVVTRGGAASAPVSDPAELRRVVERACFAEPA
jgi:uncharacterized protein YyaL (SSP411 family)